MTLTTPGGYKLRTRSRHRYIYVKRYEGRDPFIEYRTDVRERAIARLRKDDYAITQVPLAERVVFDLAEDERGRDGRVVKSVLNGSH